MKKGRELMVSEIEQTFLFSILSSKGLLKVGVVKSEVWYIIVVVVID